MTHIITKSFKDIFSGNVLLFTLKVTLISAVITAVVVWLFGGILSSFIKNYLSWIPWEWLQTTGASVATIAVAYMLFIITIAIVTSLMVEPLLIKLAAKHYPDKPVVGSPSITKSLLLSLKAGVIFLLIFLFTFPVMFIPLVGAVWMLWLWSILIKEPTLYDVGSLFITDKTIMKQKKKKTTILAMIAAAFNYIPVINIFAAVFGQILFLHHILGEEEQ
ncbi:Probable transmembrane protein [hydrothermal vent metagenome]|uniref:Probable transmembrane protein n=1 Tax=hydrothermal vent metagenome TaxID=652676 RepID=A0A1W1CCA5_9ZZZZ